MRSGTVEIICKDLFEWCRRGVTGVVGIGALDGAPGPEDNRSFSVRHSGDGMLSGGIGERLDEETVVTTRSL